MPRNAFVPVRTALAVLALCAALVVAVRAQAAPDDPKPAGTVYRNKDLGVRASGPTGWQMVADKGAAPVSWERLVTFNDRQTDAQAVLSVRPRTATTLDDLLATVRKDWEASRDRLRVSSMRKVEASALSPVALVVVDASFTRAAKPAKGKAGVPEPPSAGITYRVQATYYLGPGYTYLLYAQGQDTHWSRLRAGLDALRDSVRFDKTVDAGPVGEGSYRNEDLGFACKFPKDYTVVTPQRGTHVVQFEGVGETDPVLSVYAFEWDQDVASDAARLVAHYEEEKAGTASQRPLEIAGQQGVQVRAKAVIGGEERSVLLGVLKRGSTCFRLRVSSPVDAEGKGAAVFKAFVASFRFTSTR